MSTQYCGCDPEASHICAMHHGQLVGMMQDGLYAHTKHAEEIDAEQFKRYTDISLDLTEASPSPKVNADLEWVKSLNPTKIQKFNSGATRSSEGHKFDYEGFVNPQAEYVFAEYMHTHRFQRDGSIRDSDNWQKGIPLANYMRSMVRHMFDAWRLHRGYKVVDPDTGNPATMSDLMCAIRFNAMGYLKEIHDPSPINGGKE